MDRIEKITERLSNIYTEPCEVLRNDCMEIKGKQAHPESAKHVCDALNRMTSNNPFEVISKTEDEFLIRANDTPDLTI